MGNYYKEKLKIKIWLLIIVNLAIILLSTSCSNDNRAYTNEPKQYGNLMSNIINNGLVSQNGQWAYAKFKDGLYKMRIDGTETNKISDDLASYINVWNGWVYSSNAPDGAIYKISTEGFTKERVNNEMSYYPIIKDGWIYYESIFDMNKLYRIKDIDVELKRVIPQAGYKLRIMPGIDIAT